MEFWARWAHRALWHASLWHMHESHHRPREGPFELNDVFAVINAVPAIALLAYGFFHRGFVPGLCFGAVSSQPLTSHPVCWTQLSSVAWHGGVSARNLTRHVSLSYRASGLRCSAWPTCSSTTAWSTAASPSAPLPMCPTSGEWLPLTRYDSDETNWPFSIKLIFLLSFNFCVWLGSSAMSQADTPHGQV
jgi:hypothetical protein